MHNSLITVLNQISSEKVKIIDYRRNAADFEFLWGLQVSESDTYTFPDSADETLETLSSIKKILLIETPDSSILPTDVFGKHVGPLQWAVVVQNALATKGLAAPEIAILDISPNSKTDKDIPASISYFSCRAPDLDNLVSWILADPDPKATTSNTALSEHLQAWKIGLALANTRKDHHYLNNLLGPVALAAGIKDNGIRRAVLDSRKDKDKRQHLAAAALMRALEWGNTDKDPNSTSNSVALDKIDSRNKELRVLILDDQICDGWIPIFSHLLGLRKIDHDIRSAELRFTCCAERRAYNKRVLSLWIATSPDAVLEQLCNGPKTGSLLFTESSVGESFDEMLLLDLRLYSNDSEKERAILEKIDRLQSRKKTNNPSTYNTESNAYLEKLSGLAKLISSVDFTYPVAVWSSTGQRRVVEALKDCHNIYTGLEKPRFDAYSSSHIINDLSNDLQRTIGFCLRLLEGRYWLNKLEENSQQHRAVAKEIKKNNVVRVEIYLDEHTPDIKIDPSSPLWLGGHALVYLGNDKKSTETLSEELDKIMVTTKIKIGDNDRLFDFTERSDDKHIRKDNRKKHFNNIWKTYKSITDKLSIKVLPFALRCPDKVDIFEENKILDSRYYVTMPALVQAIMDICLHYYPASNLGLIALVAGNRIKNTGLSKKDWDNRFRRKWFMSTDEKRGKMGHPGIKYLSIGDQWMHAVASMTSLPHRWKYDAATAPCLGEVSANHTYRQSQYVPDVLLAQIHRDNDVTKELYLDTLDKSFISALEAWSYVNTGALLDGLVSAKHSAQELEKRSQEDYEKSSALTVVLLNMTMKCCTTKLDAKLFHDFCSRIEN